MELLDDEALAAGTCTADVLAQRKAGDHGAGGQRQQIRSQRLRGGIVKIRSLQRALQQQGGLGGVGKDQVGAAAELPHPVDEGRGDGGIGFAVVAHHRVDDFAGGGPEGKGLFGQSDLLFSAQIAGVDAVKLHPQLPVVFQCSRAVVSAVQPSRGAKATGMGGEHHRGQGHGLVAHDRQHRQDHRKAAAAHAGKIVDAEDFFRFIRFQQKGTSFAQAAALHRARPFSV